MKIKILAELEYDASIMQGNDKIAREWFFHHVLKGDDLTLHSNEIGDEIGTLHVTKILNDGEEE